MCNSIVTNKRFIKILTAIFYFLFIFSQTSSAFELGSPSEDEVFYQCYARSIVQKSGVSMQFCQCLNDRATEVLNQDDLFKLRANYNYLFDIEQRGGKSQPYSYLRNASLISANCAACSQKKFRNCLPKNGSFGMNRKIETMLIHIEDAQFDLVKRDSTYRSLIIDSINVVGDYCPALVRNPIEIWVDIVEENSGAIVESTGRLRLDKRMENIYKSYVERENMRSISLLNMANFEDILSGRIPLKGFSMGVELLQKRFNIIKMLGKDCSADGRMSRVYHNILSLELGDQPIKAQGKARRYQNGINIARLQNIVDTYRLDEKKRKKMQRLAGPLTCSWLPKQVNGSRQLEKVSTIDTLSMFEDYAGDYTLAVGKSTMDIKLWAKSTLPRYAQSGIYGIIGLAQVRGTECASYVNIKRSFYRGKYTGHQAELDFHLNRATRDACFATEVFSKKLAQFSGFVALGQPGKSIPFYPKKVPWVQHSNGQCKQHILMLVPSTLASDTNSFLKQVAKQNNFPIPENAW